MLEILELPLSDVPEDGVLATQDEVALSNAWYDCWTGSSAFQGTEVFLKAEVSLIACAIRASILIRVKDRMKGQLRELDWHK